MLLGEAHVQLIQRDKELLAVRFADPAAAKTHKNAVPNFVRPKPRCYCLHSRRRHHIENCLRVKHHADAIEASMTTAAINGARS